MSTVAVRIDGRVSGPALPATDAQPHENTRAEAIGTVVGNAEAVLRSHPIPSALGIVANAASGALLARHLGARLPLTIGGAVLGIAAGIGAIVGVGALRGQPLHGATGATEAAGRSPKDDHQLRVMTYNVRGLIGGTGTDPTPDQLDAVAAVVKRYHPDVLLLQEVYEGDPSYGRFGDELQSVASALHPTSIAAGTSHVYTDGARDHNAVLTFNGYGISDVRGLRLPKADSSTRGVTDTIVVAPDGRPTRVLDTHMSWESGYREEVASLGKYLAATGVGTSSMPTVIGGDWNAQSDAGRGKLERAALTPVGLRDAGRELGAVDRTTTTFTASPGHDLDRIYATHLTPVAYHVAVDAAGVSDHVPVVVDYDE